MTKSVQLHTGAVRFVFTPEGKQIKDMDEFVSEGKYIATGAEKLKTPSILSNSHCLTVASVPLAALKKPENGNIKTFESASESEQPPKSQENTNEQENGKEEESQQPEGEGSA